MTFNIRDRERIKTAVEWFEYWRERIEHGLDQTPGAQIDALTARIARLERIISAAGQSKAARRRKVANGSEEKDGNPPA